MTDEERQRLNVRAIRVTLASALRHAGPHQADLCMARARQLLEHVRHQAKAASVLSDIDALEAELRGSEGAPHQRES